MEFALILPVMLIILFGIVEFGLLIYNQQVITNAAREGARFGIVARAPRHTSEEIRAVVDQYIENRLITFGEVKVAATEVVPDSTLGAMFGSDLVVEVTFPYEFLVLPNFLGNLLGVTELRTYSLMKFE